MIKKFINIFMLLVFTMQVLPVKQVGSMLFGNQITEDVLQDTDDVDDLAKDGFKLEGKSEFIEPAFTSLAPFFSAHLFMLKELSVIFPHNHSSDIYSPPPNTLV